MEGVKGNVKIPLKQSCINHGSLASQTSTGIWEIPRRGRECSKINIFPGHTTVPTHIMFSMHQIRNEAPMQTGTETLLGGGSYSAENVPLNMSPNIAQLC